MGAGLEVVGDGEDDEFVDVVDAGEFFEAVADAVGGAVDAAGLHVGEVVEFGLGVGEVERFFDGGDAAADAAVALDAPAPAAPAEALGFFVGFGDGDGDAEAGAGLGADGRALEAVAVFAHDLFAAFGGDEVGEAEGPAEFGGDVSAVVRGAEHPEFGHGGAGRSGVDAAVFVVGWEVVGEPAVEVEELFGEVVDAEGAGSVDEGAGGATVAAGCAADAEVDAVGELGGDGAEVFGDFEAAVVGEHDAAGADADVLGAGGDLGDEDFGGGAGEGAGVVVLGEPVAGVAESVAGFGELEGFGDGLGGAAAGADGDLVEHAEPH